MKQTVQIEGDMKQTEQIGGGHETNRTNRR